MDRKRKFKDWIFAVRPWSFPASFISVLVTMSYIYYRLHSSGSAMFAPNGADWWNGWLALLMIILFHAAGNLLSDYSDHIKGVDRPGSLNGVTHIQSGKFTPKGIARYGVCFLLVASAVGLVILSRSSFNYIWIALISILLTVGYPWLKAHALGDVNILLCFALIPSLGVSLIVTSVAHYEVMLLSLTYGLLIVAILHANNTRDAESDTNAGLTTLCGTVGRRASQFIYLFELTVPYLLVLIFVLVKWLPWITLFLFITIPLAIKNIRIIFSDGDESSQLRDTLDKSTAQLELVFGLLLSLSLLVSSWI